MSDADLIYNALLRAERAAEAEIPRETHAVTFDLTVKHAVLAAIHAIREEVGNGLSGEGR